VSSSENHASIAEHGLDWRRMGVTGGIAVGLGRGGPYRPELEAVFLCETLDDVEFFVSFGQHPLVDVWVVDMTGLPIEPGPDGWVLCREPIPAVRVRLLHADRPPEQRELCSVWLSFVSSRLSAEATELLDRIAAAEAGLARLAAASDESSFGVHAGSASWRLDVDAAALLDRIGAEIAIAVGES
jgi:hypothetical protein